MRELLPLLRAGGRRHHNTPGTRWRAAGGAAVMSLQPAFRAGGKGGQCVPHSRTGTRDVGLGMMKLERF
jgi:hypothetical protein